MKKNEQILRSGKKAKRENQFGGFSFTRSSSKKITVMISQDTKDIEIVEVNGDLFYKKGTVREIVRVATMIFQEYHFSEVDDLVVSGMTKKGACESVSEKYNFKFESFRQQYYKRHENLVIAKK